MTTQTGAKPDCGFDDPIGLLKDCHRQMERFLHTLWVVADSAVGRKLTSAETAAVQSALLYFRTDGPRHSADELNSLFPRLRAESITGDSQELGILENNLHLADRTHATVDTLYSAWISDGWLSPENEFRLQSGTEKLKRLFEEHARLEERIVFPRAVQMLDGRAIAAIGREFRARRR